MIAITGKNGYISTGLELFLKKRGYETKLVSVRENIGKDIFKNTDVVVHAAGIVHIKAKEDIYRKINVDLTKKLAETAKQNGVGHFIFISSMSVYGMIEGEITADTPPSPTNEYGRSKLEAEQNIEKLADSNFKVTILRPPMVYGKNCPGNYSRLSGLISKISFFPLMDNKRSMIFCENLYNCIKKIIDEKISGIVHPQNKDYVNTSMMCAEIAKCKKRRLFLSKKLGKVLSILPFNTIKKVFGSLYYSKDIVFTNDIVDLKKSIELTEK